MTAAVSTPLRQRIVAAAVELTTTQGWAHVTMSRLAERVGVSRQTVYNEIGTKPALAEAMILAELDRFLAAVESAFDRHPDDLPERDPRGRGRRARAGRRTTACCTRWSRPPTAPTPSCSPC